MLVLALACLVLAVALAAWLVRTRSRLAAVEHRLSTVSTERDDARMAAADADLAATVARRERDDALDRVQRARRDAAEVGARLREASTARETAEAAVAEATARVGVLEAETSELRRTLSERETELEAARDASTAAHAEVDDADVLWALALARVERTWQTSISLGLDEESPLVGPDPPLKVAVEIEIGAAREEAGADIELRWEGEGAVPPATALVVFGVIESVVQSVAKTAASTIIEVTIGTGAVDVAFSSVDDDGGEHELDLPEPLRTEPGRIRVPISR